MCSSVRSRLFPSALVSFRFFAIVRGNLKFQVILFLPSLENLLLLQICGMLISILHNVGN